MYFTKLQLWSNQPFPAVAFYLTAGKSQKGLWWRTINHNTMGMSHYGLNSPQGGTL